MPTRKESDGPNGKTEEYNETRKIRNYGNETGKKGHWEN